MANDPEDEVIDAPDSQDDAPEVSAERAAIEQRAREGGWAPRNEWRGNPDIWIDAPEFVRRGETYVPFVKKQLRETEGELRRTREEVATLRNTVEDQNRTLRELVDMAKTANQQGYDRALRDLKAQQRAAAEAGDLVKHDQVTEQLDAMQEARAAAKPADVPPARRDPDPAPQPRAQAKIDPAVQAFVDENPWYNSDRVLNAAMLEEHERLLAESPAMALGENLRRAKEAVMAQFPKKFGIAPQRSNVVDKEDQTRRNRRNPVNGPTPPADQRVRASAIDSIEDPAERAEARSAYKRQRNYLGAEYTEEVYMNLYNNPKADLDLAKKKRSA